MLTKVEIRTRQGSLLSLPLEDDSSGFFVEEIQGLDPVKATLVSSSFSGMDGEFYQAGRRETRNIQFKLGLDPDPAVESVWELRNQIYGFFMPKAEVFLKFFMSNGLIVDISGVVETCVSPMFTSDPVVDVSIICYQPDLVDPVPVLVSDLSTGDMQATYIDYKGTVNTGLVFELTVDLDMSGFTIYHTPPDDEIRTLQFEGDLFVGDVLTISTVPGFKRATVLRGGISYSMLYAVSPESNWIQMMPGTNAIRVYSEGEGRPYTIQYLNRYGGL
jgi:hypothetical protein